MMFRNKLAKDNDSLLNIVPKMERRTVLDWLGKGVVLSLTSPLIGSCLGDITTDLSNHDQEPFDFPFKPGPASLDLWKDFQIYTVDPQDLAPILNTWKLKIDGLVKSPREFEFAELLDLKRSDITVDFHCITGWSVHNVPWNGLHLKTIFDHVDILSNATHATFHTIGEKYNESLPLTVALEPKTILAFGVNGYTLPLGHGFPLRLVAPRLWAYKSAKYVYRVELTDQAFHGYWEDRGYSYRAEVPEHLLRTGRY